MIFRTIGRFVSARIGVLALFCILLGSTAAADPMAKISPTLADKMKSEATNIRFVARIKAGTELDNYGDQIFVRPFVGPDGNTVASGFASRSQLLAMAGDAGVLSLRSAESTKAPLIQADEDVSAVRKAKIEAKIQLGADAISPGPAPEGWYHSTGALHGSQEAWSKGYTGEGVRYMSNDSGADYCHADLFGTWAYIDDSGSPYYGLPQMFDSYSSYNAALDFYLGTSQIADGLADYADTSATAAGDFTYQPLGAAVAHDYTVPPTSKSGTYHYGSHPDKALGSQAGLLSSFFGDGTAVAGERAAILVVDETTAGVYDTVYVDINYNFDFTDDTPARLSRDFAAKEAACLDYDLDGLNDVSGGLVYFISDGVTAVPTLDWFWGIPGSFFGNGDLVAFHVMDYFEGGGDHGMGTTSSAVGQGVTTGSIYWGPGGSPIAGGQGLVVGPGKDVFSTQNGNWYISPFIEDGYFYAGLGYDGVPGTGDDVQIVSNSWGFSGIDNDGWDSDSRLIDNINRALAPNTTLLFSTGNGAAGYGTVAPPSPASAVGVGASTLFGSIGVFEPIASADQVLGGDVISWSNRGPGARAIAGADVVATGAFGTGSVALNQTLWGAISTADFGGTSQAAPVAAGNLALMYQAWRERTGSWPTFEEARALLMGTAKDIGHDAWSMGAGLVDSDEGTDVAAGTRGVFVMPAEWPVGDYRGDEFTAFANIIAPGGSDEQTFTVHNPSGKKLNLRIDAVSFNLIRADTTLFKSNDISEDHGAFTTPDYVWRIDRDIPQQTELLQVRITKPYLQFDPNDDLFEPFSNWRVHLQNWTDLNGDGQFWIDANGNGKVDLGGEMQTGEHMRFSYGYNTGPTQQVRISNPLERIDDGLLMSLRHRNEVASVPTTDIIIERSYWARRNWSWVKTSRKQLKVPAGGDASFTASIKIPPNTPYGMYEGEILLAGQGSEVVIPVTIAVAAEGTSMQFGETNYKNGQASLYDNENVFGYTDYSWRAESGDWRFYFLDIPEGSIAPSGQTLLVVDNSWAGNSTDIDTIILGPSADGFPSATYGPYTLDIIGRSEISYIGSGRWGYQTSSGGPREIVATPLTAEGLHAILLHQVKVDGSALDDQFGGKTGRAVVTPGEVAASGPAGPGSATVTIESELALENFVAQGFGFGSEVTTVESVNQDDPNDPSTASFSTNVVITNGALLEVSTANSGNGSDLDLYVYDSAGNLLGASTTPTDEERVAIFFPADDTYRVDVHGWSVPAGTDTFELTINAVQGTDITVTDAPVAIPAGGSGELTVEWDTTGFAPGNYQGVVLTGPADAPGLIQVPVNITVN